MIYVYSIAAAKQAMLDGMVATTIYTMAGSFEASSDDKALQAVKQRLERTYPLSEDWVGHSYYCKDQPSLQEKQP
jgi:hypothetical protein